jgi:hypothetical protein
MLLGPDYAARDRRSNAAGPGLSAHAKLSLADKFLQAEPRESAISFTSWSRPLTDQSRYPRILWISLSKKPVHKCVSLGFPRAVPVAQKLGMKGYLFEIM